MKLRTAVPPIVLKYEREQSQEDRASYAASEECARAEKRGLWRDKDPVARWDWRKKP